MATWRRGRGARAGRGLAAGVLLALAAALSVASARGGAEAPTPGPASPGEALGAAVSLWRSGDASGAAERFAEVEAQHPLIADHAARLRVRALLDAGRADEAAAAAHGFAAVHADSPLRADVLRLLGEAHDAAGETEAARTAWRAALAESRDDAQRAALHAHIARSLEAAGLDEAAAQAWLVLFGELAAQPPAEGADAALARLEGRLGRPLRTPERWLARAGALYAAFDNEGALFACDRALAGGLEGSGRRAALLRRAHSLFRLRRYPEASEAFAALGPEAEARFWGARSLARRGDIDGAVRAFDAFAVDGRAGAYGPRALQLAGTLLEDEGRRDEARARYRAVLQRGSADLRAEARWRLAWMAWREGRMDRAAGELARLAADQSDPLARLRALYWEARSRQRQDAADGEQRLRALARSWPLSYYGWRAALRVDGTTPAVASPPPPSGSAADALSLPERSLGRVRALVQAGLSEEAGGELALLAPRARSLADRLELAGLFRAAGDYHGSQNVVLGGDTLARLARGPEAGPFELWWAAWPMAFRSAVEEAADAAPGLERELIWAVMREESGYRPRVVSPAGARGLLQIMPTTGARLASELGLGDFDPAWLFEPERNVRLGGHYLASLLEQFQGRVSAAVGGYNAGAEPVARWLRERPDWEDDEWVEAIPYTQTREYVMRVLRSLHAYRSLY
jgi:soluble lytic murein transglycosylase